MAMNWKKGLFDITIRDLAKSMFCPCVIYSKNEAMLNSGKSTHPFVDCATCAGIYLYDVYVLTSGNSAYIPITSFLLYAQRCSVKAKYGIDENNWKSMLVTAFCQPCSLAQIEYELKSIKQDQENQVPSEGPKGKKSE